MTACAKAEGRQLGAEGPQFRAIENTLAGGLKRLFWVQFAAPTVTHLIPQNSLKFPFSLVFFGRGSGIRTRDLLLPKKYRQNTSGVIPAA